MQATAQKPAQKNASAQNRQRKAKPELKTQRQPRINAYARLETQSFSGLG